MDLTAHWVGYPVPALFVAASGVISTKEFTRSRLAVNAELAKVAAGG